MKSAILLISATHAINWHATLALIIIVAIIVLFFVLALYSNILRDEVNDCDAFNQQVATLQNKTNRLIKPENPYSLSRTQLAVWTVIISCSFIYLALCKGDCSDSLINQTALILMGIGAAVTTTSTIIDKREIRDGRARHQNAPSDSFFVDILSDDNGISIHRFQNVVWTGIAMIVYLNKVYSITSGCMLPELSQTLLILTGISSTTYLFLKANENNPDIEVAQNNSQSDTTTDSGFSTPSTLNSTAVIPTTPVPVPTPSTSVDTTGPSSTTENQPG